MEELFQDGKTESIFPDTGGAGSFATDKQKQNTRDLIQLSSPLIGVDVAEAASQEADTGNVAGARRMIEDKDMEISKSAIDERIRQTLIQGTSEALAADIKESIALERDKQALEKLAVEAAASTIPVKIRDMVDENVLETIKKREAWALAVGNFIEMVDAEEEDENILEELPDFLKMFTLIESAEGWFQGGVGTQVDKIRALAAKGRNLPPEQHAAFLKDELRPFIEDSMFIVNNPAKVVELMSAAADGSNDAKADLVIMQAVGLGMLPFEFLGASKAKSIMKNIGNTPMLADDVVDGARQIVRSEAEVASEIISVKAPFDENYSIAGEVGERLQKTKERLDHTRDNITSPESPEEMLAGVEKSFNTKFVGERVLGSNLDFDETGIAHLKVGTQNGTPFKREADAQRFIDRNNLEGVVEANGKGGFHVKMSQKIQGFDSSVKPALTWWGKYFGNINNIISRSVVSKARAVEGSADAIIAAGVDVARNSLKILGTKQGVDLNRLIQRGIDKSEWLSPAKFHKKYRRVYGRLPSQKETEAYFAFRQVNDFVYEVNVKRLHRESVARGDRAFHVGDMIVRGAPKKSHHIIRDGTNEVPIHVFESGNHGTKTIGKGHLNEETLNSLQETHTFVKVGPDEHTRLFENGVVSELTNWIAVPKTLKPKDVDPYSLLPYKAGGRRRNQSPAYLKVAKVKGTEAGTVRLSDSTTHGSVSLKEAGRAADDMNDIFDAVKRARDEGTDLSLLDDFVASKGLDKIGIATAREADEFFNSHSLYKYDEIKFQGVRDRQNVDMGGKDVTSLIDETEDPAISSIRNAHNGKRGDRLMNLDGEESLIMDPLGALMDSLDSAAKLTSVSGFRRTSLEFMEKKFGQYLVREVNGNPVDILNAGLKKAYENKAGLRKVVEAHQRYLKDILSKRTPSEDGWLSKVESTIDDAFDKGSELRKGLDGDWVETGAGRNFVRGVVAKDPATRVKSLVFNSKLGLGNVASFLAQAATIPNVIAISPKHGLRAAMRAFPARLAVAGGVDRPMLEYMAKGWKAGGFKSKEDFIEYVDEFRHLGVGNITQNIAEVGGKSSASGGMGIVGAAVRGSRAPFNEGELLSRLTAYGTARDEWLDLGKGSAKSPAGREWIGNRMHNLTLGFSSADLQLGFRGLAGVPTQFWSYPFRYVGALTGKTFTPMERTRLALMNLVLYGSAGVPIVDNITQSVVGDSKDIDSETARIFTNGAIDSMLFTLSDGRIDPNVSGRLGTGGFFTDLVKGLVEKGTLEYLSGAGGNTSHGLVSTFSNVLTGYAAFRNPTYENVSMLTWDILKAEISSLKNLDKTARALDTGWIYTKSGRRYDRITKAGGIAMFLGVPPQSYESGSLLYQSEERLKKKIKDSADMIVSLKSKLDAAIASGSSDETLAGYRSAIEVLGMESRELGIYSQVNGLVISAATSKGMIEKMIEQQSLRERSGVQEGVQQLINQKREETQQKENN